MKKKGKTFTCIICGKAFYLYPSEINKKWRGKYCSLSCYHTNQRQISPKNNCICDYCGKGFYIRPSHIANGEGKWCSRKCKRQAQLGEYRICQICGKKSYFQRNQIENGEGACCSNECKYESQRNGELHNCLNCGKEFYAKIAEIKKGGGKYCSISCAMITNNKKRWEEGIYDGVFRSPTSIELAMRAALEELDILYKKEWRPDNYSRIFDFKIDPNVLIEVQGDYWHSLEKNKSRDIEKANWAKNNGFQIVEIWENEIKRIGSTQLIKDRVLPLMGDIR